MYVAGHGANRNCRSGRIGAQPADQLAAVHHWHHHVGHHQVGTRQIHRIDGIGAVPGSIDQMPGTLEDPPHRDLSQEALLCSGVVGSI